MKNNPFEGITSLNDLKKEYRRLALLYHPDCGGSNEKMKQLNADYAATFKIIKAKAGREDSFSYQPKTAASNEAPEDFIQIIDRLLRLDGLTVELCGSWLWIGGETRKHREELKAAGCHWAPHKGLWSWHFAEDSCYTKRKSGKDMAEIRDKYGSTLFTAEKREAIAQ